MLLKMFWLARSRRLRHGLNTTGPAQTRTAIRRRATRRAGGTYVPPHQQTNPNSTQTDNYGTRGDINLAPAGPGRRILIGVRLFSSVVALGPLPMEAAPRATSSERHASGPQPNRWPEPSAWPNRIRANLRGKKPAGLSRRSSARNRSPMDFARV
jgi:hypothetical protein